MYFQSSSRWVLRFRIYDTHCAVFLTNIKLEQLQITVLKPSCDCSKTNNICKFSLLLSKCLFKASLHGSLVLRSMIHANGIFFKYQTGAIADHSFEAMT